MKELRTRFKQLWHYQQNPLISTDSPKKSYKIPSSPQKIQQLSKQTEELFVRSDRKIEKLEQKIINLDIKRKGFNLQVKNLLKTHENKRKFTLGVTDDEYSTDYQKPSYNQRLITREMVDS